MITAKLLVEAMLAGDTTPVMPVDLPEPGHPDPLDARWDNEDLALEYIEGEVGRHDWQRNWKDHSGRHGDKLRSVIQAWLDRYEIDHDPQGLIDFIEKDLLSRPGRWS